MSQEPTPFRFYKMFFVNDIHELSPLEKSKIVQFLRRLLQNPDSPDFEEVEGFYAFEFSPTRVLYWKLIRKDNKLVGIDVLKMITLRSFSGS